MKKTILLLLFLFFANQNGIASRIKKGFERLKVYDYFNARESFLKSMKSDASAASYGLARIYSSGDNPFHNLDSARTKILYSDSIYHSLSEKKKKRYVSLGVTSEAIQTLKDSICSRAQRHAESSRSVAQLNHFLENFTFCVGRDEIADLRNSIAFKEAQDINTSEAYTDFMRRYPDAEENLEAQNRYHERVYSEQTQSGQLGAFERFIELYPASPFKMEAERMIYSIATSQGGIADHKAFIARYPSNRYVRESWREIYKLSMQDYDEQTYLRFRFDFPDYPYMDELESDFKLQTSLFLPFYRDSRWGFINEYGEEMIPAMYDEVNYFSEGLAAVSKDGLYGYINKTGKVVIPFMWDDAEPFHNHCAVVSRQDKYGLLARNGEFIIPLEYDEISDPVEDRCVVMKDGKFGYTDKTGTLITGMDFDIAGDFHNGFAIVGIDDAFGLINARGDFVIEADYDHLSRVSSELLKASVNDKWGLINRVGEVRLPFMYDAIGEFYENRALVARDGKCGFVNSEGELVIPITYRFTENMLGTAVFRGGHALISNKGKNTLIDSVGNKLQFPGYENIGTPSSGFIPVQKNRKWGFVDYNGRLKIPCTFQDLSPFQHHFAIAKSANLSGIIDTSGKWVLEPAYDMIERNSMHFILHRHGLSGLCSKAGKLLVPCEYDRIEILFEKVAMLQKGDSRVYISADTGKVIWGRLE